MGANSCTRERAQHLLWFATDINMNKDVTQIYCAQRIVMMKWFDLKRCNAKPSNHLILLNKILILYKYACKHFPWSFYKHAKSYKLNIDVHAKISIDLFIVNSEHISITSHEFTCMKVEKWWTQLISYPQYILFRSFEYCWLTCII